MTTRRDRRTTAAVDDAITSPEFGPLWAEVGRRLGHSHDRMDLLKREFVRALSLKTMNDDSGGMPTELDSVWHEAVLNTRYYAALCERVCGRFVHHSTFTETDDAIERRSRIDAIVIAYRERFGCEPEQSIWDDENEAEIVPNVPQPFSQVFVKNLNGRVTTCTGLTAATTIWGLKEVVEAKIGIPPNEQRLIYAGKVLDDFVTCVAHGLQNDCTVTLVQKMSGC